MDNSIVDTQSKTLLRPTTLAEALWACALDDYLSEEEEGEFVKILGNKETRVPWYLKNEAVCAPIRPDTHAIHDDPRDARTRGGRELDSSDEERDGTPGVYDELSQPEMPPLLWLSIPQIEESGKDSVKREPDWAAVDLDWDAGTTDWDISVQSSRIKKQLKGKNYTRGGENDASSQYSPVSLIGDRQHLSESRPKRSSRGPSYASEPSARTSPRLSSHSRSSNAFPKTSLRARKDIFPRSLSRISAAARSTSATSGKKTSRISSDALTRSRSMKSRSKTRRQGKPRQRLPLDDNIERRQPSNSRRTGSSSRRQSGLKIFKNRAASPPKAPRKNSPVSKSCSKKKSASRNPSTKRRAS